VLAAVAVELLLLVLFLGWAPLADLLDQEWPTAAGWFVAASAVPAVITADTLHKVLRRRRREER
jgi:hypothetical protein